MTDQYGGYPELPPHYEYYEEEPPTKLQQLVARWQELSSSAKVGIVFFAFAGISLLIALNVLFVSLKNDTEQTITFISEELEDFPVDGNFVFAVPEGVVADDVTATQQFSVSPAIEGTFSWDQESKELTYSPSQRLVQHTEYTLSLHLPGAAPAQWTIKTTGPFAVVSVSPSNMSRDIPLEVPIKILFNYRTFSMTTFSSHFTISPPVDGVFSQEGKEARFFPNQPLQKETEYTVTITKGLTNSAEEIITDDYQWSFRTTGDRAQEYLTFDQPLVSASYYDEHIRIALPADGLIGTLHFTVYPSDQPSLIAGLLPKKDETGKEIPLPHIPDLKAITPIQLWDESIPSDFAKTYTRYITELPRLEPGLYILQASLTLPNNEEKSMGTSFLSIAKSAFILAHSTQQTSAWIADIQTSIPLKNVALSLTSLQTEKNETQQITTNDEGMITLPNISTPSLLFTSKSDDPSVLYIATPLQKNNTLLWAQTDKSAYINSDVVRGVGYLRMANPTTGLTMPATTTQIVLTFTSSESPDHIIWTTPVVTDQTGMFTFSFPLGNDLIHGNYTLFAKVGDEPTSIITSLSVVSPPKTILRIRTDKESYVSKDSATVFISATDSQGAPLKKAKISYVLSREITSFLPNLFLPRKTTKSSWKEGTLTLDDNGAVTLPVDTTLQDFSSDAIFVVDAYVSDSPEHHGYAAFSVAKTEFTLLPTIVSAVMLATPITATIQSKTIEGKPYALADVQVSLSKIGWKGIAASSEYNKQTASADVEAITFEKTLERIDYIARQTDASGNLSYNFTPSQQGEYQITLVGKDKKGNEKTTTYPVHVLGPPDPSAGQLWSSALRMYPEKQSYTTGEKATILIASSRLDGNVFISYSSIGLTKTTTLPLVKGQATFTLPIDAILSPNCSITASTFFNDKLISTTLSLPVNLPTGKTLVSVTPDKTSYHPGDAVTMQLGATLDGKNPREGTFTVSVVDRSIFALWGDPAGNPFQNAELSFLQSSLGRLFSLTIPPNTSLSNNTGPVAFWSGPVASSASGTATINFSLPSTIGSWIVITRFSSKDNAKDITTTYTTVPFTQDLLVSLQVPTAGTIGDRFPVRLLTQNYTAQDIKLELTCTSSDPSALALDGKDFSIHLNSAQTLQTIWNASVLKSAREVTVSCSAGERKFSQKLILHSEGSTQHTSFAGEVADISYQKELQKNQGEDVLVTLYPSLHAVFYETAQYLHAQMPRTTEDRASLLGIASSTYAIASKAGVKDNLWLEYLKTIAESTLATLAGDQHSDGGFGWIASAPSDPIQTALVLEGCYLAQKNSWTIPTTVTTKAQHFLSTTLEKNTLTFHDQAVILYVLGHFSSPNISLLEALAKDSSLDQSSQGFVALALPVSSTVRQQLLSKLVQNIHYEGDSAYFDGIDNVFVGDALTATTTILRALAEIKQNEQLPSLIRWTIGKKDGVLWQHNAVNSLFAVEALSSLNTQIQEPNFDYQVLLGGVKITSGVLNTSTHEPLFFPLKLTKEREKLSLNKSGRGSLYYLLTQQQGTPQTLAQGCTVTRTFSDVNRKTTSMLSLGQVANVTLEFACAENQESLVITDTFLGGSEPRIDSSTESLIAPQGVGSLSYDFFADHLALYLQQIPKGPHQLTYMVQANAQGTFIANPATVLNPHNPKITAQTGTATMTIAP